MNTNENVDTTKSRKNKNARKRKKILILTISAALVVVVVLIGGGIIMGKIVQSNTKQPVVEETTEVIEETTETVENSITPEMEADFADYTAVLTTMKKQDISSYDVEQKELIETLIIEMEVLLTDKTATGIEEKINNLAYEFDRFRIKSAAGDMFYSRGILIANKQHCLPQDFYPGENTLARSEVDRMIAAAAEEGISLYDFSTFRSYETQASLYDRYVAADGEAAANRYSAKPGCSEHQTGLAFDIGGNDKSRWAEVTFDGTAEAEWLAANAHNYGFILRYPEGKEEITGYMHESWHYRFVGDIAPRFKESGISTLEEYLGLV